MIAIGDGDDSEVKRHRRRRTVSTLMTSSAFDANGNRILKVSRRDTGGTDVADVETAEKVIQVTNKTYGVEVTLYNKGHSIINICFCYP